LRSIRNDIGNWSKVIDSDEKKRTKETNYYSPAYDGYVFQFNFDKKIGIVYYPSKSEPTKNIYELVLDYQDYDKGEYPDKIKLPILHLIKTIFTDKIKNLDNLIPKTNAEIAESTRDTRSEKLKNLWKNEKDNT